MQATDGDGAGILTEVLPLDVIASIFLRLPFKTILTLRCVNKFCRDFTSTPDFVNAHIKLSAQDDNLSSYEFFHISGSFGPTVTRFSTTPYFLKDRMPLNDRDDCFPWNTNSHRRSVTLGSSKDLICTVKYDKFVQLWNPSTRVLQQLKPLEYSIPLPCLINMRPNLVRTIFGFGYHHSTDDHKVVAIIRYEGSLKTVVRVCSLKRNYWRSTVVDRTGLSSKIFSFAQDSTTPVSGKIHWMDMTEIVSFDLGKEVFGMVEPPSFVRDAEDEPFIRWGVLSGCLCLVCLKRGDLWLMKEYGVQDSWTIIASNILRNIHTRRPCLSLIPCSVLPNNQILFACQNRFLLYNPKDNSLADPAEKWDACCAYDIESSTRDFMCLKLNFTCLE